MRRFVSAALLVTIIAVTASGAPRDALRSFTESREGCDPPSYQHRGYEVMARVELLLTKTGAMQR